ncbi:MAG TPA: flagellar motor protein MotB [Acidobacteriota bacterium]|nr:flagellar motor protein MotB [Acidobacteriota bacterium]
MRGRKRKEVPENPERWLLTYADLITLLLAFFVVMYSMSRLDAKKFGAMSSALSGILKGQDASLPVAARDLRADGGPLKTGRLRLMQQQLRQRIGEAGIDSSVTTEVNTRGLIIHIREGALFEEARAELTPGARDVLRLVGEQLGNIPNQLRVEGHTDARPIQTPRFPSNWELSTARATSVLRYLVDSAAVSPGRVSAVGFGEFRPVAPNTSPEQMALNRRVDLVILTTEMTLAEPQVPDTLQRPTGTEES